MKDDPKPPDDRKTPHDRFVDLGKRVMTVPRKRIESLEKEWQRKKQTKRR